MTESVFMLNDKQAAKSAPELIRRDEEQFSAIARALDAQRERAHSRLHAAQLAPADPGGQAVERDVNIRRLSSAVRMLERFDIDMCLGRMVVEGEREPIYIGRMGLSDDDGEVLLVDWRTPAAGPFFAATHADPLGLASRRRYRWQGLRITDYWDEAFTADGLAHAETLDDQSAFVASLGANRSTQMRDVLATIQSDQDAIIRDSSRGALVVDGGPGTGKTVVALHRAAFLMYSDPRLRDGRGGMLFVGPSDPYLAYVADVLPRLGEDGVQMTSMARLSGVSEPIAAEVDPRARQLKESLVVIGAIDALVNVREQPPTTTTVIETDWVDLTVPPGMWREAFDAVEPGVRHNEARESVREVLVELLVARTWPEFGSPAAARRALSRSAEVDAAVMETWPELDGADLLASLYSDAELLATCAPELSEADVNVLQRTDPRAWTDADLALLDGARLRVGSGSQFHVERERAALAEAERAYRADVVDSLLAANNDPGLLTMLRADDAERYFADETILPEFMRDSLAGPFSHVMVDEAQELTDAQWHTLVERCPSRSFTIVGDRAQARHGFTESWEQRLQRVGLRSARMATLTINYRTPEEIMAEAAPVIRAALPDANVPTSVRSSGIPVHRGSVDERDRVLAQWLDSHAEGIACVIGDPSFAGSPRVQSLDPVSAKGLEFDLVVLVSPENWGTDITAAVDRYVAMTRATSELVILT